MHCQKSEPLPGDNKTFVIQPTEAELESRLAFKGAKRLTQKHFTLYHDVEFVYDPVIGAFWGLIVWELFQFGPLL